MLKLICILFFGLAVTISVWAQADTAVSSVRYSFTHVRDTNNRATPYTENMILYLGKKETVYQSLDRIISRDRIRKAVEDHRKLSPEQQQQNPLSIVAGRTTSAEYFYKNPGEAKLRTMENLLGNIYYAEEPMPVIQWKIEQVTKTIGGFSCQLATASFKGRKWNAWFCAQLPYSDGPWKLNGLPGLILEAYDEKKEVVFAFASFEGTVSDPVPIEMDKRARLAAAKDIQRMRETLKKNVAAMSAAAATGDVKGSMQRTAGTGSSERDEEEIINNPIELND